MSHGDGVSAYDLTVYAVEGFAARGERCGCDEEDCWVFDADYPYCAGCDDHHRAPVAPPGYRCPVDRTSEAFEVADAPGGDGLPDVAATASR